MQIFNSRALLEVSKNLNTVLLDDIGEWIIGVVVKCVYIFFSNNLYIELMRGPHGSNRIFIPAFAESKSRVDI